MLIIKNSLKSLETNTALSMMKEGSAGKTYDKVKNDLLGQQGNGQQYGSFGNFGNFGTLILLKLKKEESIPSTSKAG